MKRIKLQIISPIAPDLTTQKHNEEIRIVSEKNIRIEPKTNKPNKIMFDGVSKIPLLIAPK